MKKSDLRKYAKLIVRTGANVQKGQMVVISSHVNDAYFTKLVVEEIEEDSRYYIEENYIVISDKLILDKTEALKCLIHELRHCYQFNCVRNNVLTNNWFTHIFSYISTCW